MPVAAAASRDAGRTEGGLGKKVDAVLRAQNVIMPDLIHHIGVPGQGFFSSQTNFPVRQDTAGITTKSARGASLSI